MQTNIHFALWYGFFSPKGLNRLSKTWYPPTCPPHIERICGKQHGIHSSQHDDMGTKSTSHNYWSLREKRWLSFTSLNSPNMEVRSLTCQRGTFIENLGLPGFERALASVSLAVYSSIIHLLWGPRPNSAGVVWAFRTKWTGEYLLCDPCQNLSDN